MELASVQPCDVVVDLGCGYGRACIAAARRGSRHGACLRAALRCRRGSWLRLRSGMHRCCETWEPPWSLPPCSLAMSSWILVAATVGHASLLRDVGAAMELASVQPCDVVVDLGCGYGRACIA